MSCSARRRSGKRNLGHGATGRPGPAQRHPRRKQPGRSAGQSERHDARPGPGPGPAGGTLGSFSCADVLAYCWKLLLEQVVAVMPVCTFLALFQVACVRTELEAPRACGAPRTACLLIAPTAHLPDFTDARAQVLAMGQRIDHALEILLGLTLVIAGLALFETGARAQVLAMGQRIDHALEVLLGLTLVIVAGAVGVQRFRLECVHGVPMPACIGVVLFARSTRHVSAQARRWLTFVASVFSQHTHQVLAF